MSLKVEIVTPPSKPSNDYPKLMLSDGERLVLFINRSEGVLLKGFGDRIHYCDSWADKVFKDFDGKITLSNS